MWHWLSTAIHTYLLHPLTGAGYQWWSGAGSDLGELTLLAAALGAYKHVACEQPRCWRPGHRHPEHGRPVCRKHFHRDLTPPAPERTR